MQKMTDLSSRSSTPTGTGTPLPATQPISDCERRRVSIVRLERQNILIEGYTNFLTYERNSNSTNTTGVAETIERNLQETIEARDKLVSELRTLPPCLDVNCPDHTTLKPKNNDNLNVNEIEMISPNSTKKSSLKRKNSKGSSDGFVFPSKSARPITPTPVLDPIATSNSFENLEQDAEIDQEKSPEIPVPKPPTPVFLKIKDNYRDQLNKIIKNFPDVKFKSSGNYIKLNLECHEQYRKLTDFMDEDREIEFFVIKPKDEKPIKVVIKGLPGCTKTDEIVSDLEDLGYSVTSVSQLISRKTKLSLPFFLITMPRNKFNLTVFDLSLICVR
ncbi:uncharacterized protein TNIN_236761 [Trichonephila inaurata madagascariensis]|uniref:Pre-C2HC domain-containing protein n=1 Tax=Trichonephila inaurata madagascariensis TaxID=2747483 RepID=A0A8X7C5L5_9ARAC|nr:uncharacterized protein TNIN_236761 [Trichonephila inaurata madagascariensis]